MSSTAALRESETECRRLARSHYENFVVASVLLPRRLRQPFYNVYAFCRTADDLADESPSPEIALAGLADLQGRLDAIFNDHPPQQTSNAAPSLFPALNDTIKRFDLPKQPFDDLLSAFRQDQRQARYQTFNDVADYCRRSAHPVGHLLLRMTDSYNHQNAFLSDEICTGLQLANFCQGVADDWKRGRLYLPQVDLDRFEVTESMLDEPSAPQPLRDLIESECNRAETYLQRGLPLADRVAKWFASDVRLFVHGGLEIINAIRRANHDVLKQQPKVSKWQQVVLVGRAMTGLL